MSHFTVTVRLPAAVVDEQGIDGPLAEALLPYKESGAGDDDPPGLKKYLQFEDREDELRKEWEEETTERVKCPDGKLLSPYDDQFRARPLDLLGPSHVVPADYPRVEVPFKTAYPTFEQFVNQWAGYSKRDPEKGRYGHWTNPNQKWDWYTVGGRWSNRIFTKDGNEADVCRISLIDFAKHDVKATSEALSFWRAYRRAVAKKDFGTHPFKGPRSTALDIGLVCCKDENELTADDRDPTKSVLLRWDREPEPGGMSRYDVCNVGMAEADFLRDHQPEFNSLTSFAFIDPEKGWTAPGEMGWFGTHDARGEKRSNFKRAFVDWLKSGNQDDYIVNVDCHI